MAGKPGKKEKSKTTFIVHGPFKVPVKTEIGGKSIDEDCLGDFWSRKEIKDVADKNGCYVFAVNLAQGAIKPWYVGKTSKGFRGECFADHKQKKYGKVLHKYGACTPVLFLLVSSVPQAKNRISDLEKFFIDLAVTANPEIQQIKDVPRPEWTIPGVTESNGKGGVSTAVLSLRKAFGLKPPPKKAATKKKRTRKA